MYAALASLMSSSVLFAVSAAAVGAAGAAAASGVALAGSAQSVLQPKLLLVPKSREDDLQRNGYLRGSIISCS